MPDQLAARPHPPLAMRLQPGGRQAESYRALRHRLAEDGDPRIVLITSPMTGEGKSVVSANLALAVAELGRHRVLLLEANPRHPSLARAFGIAEPARGARETSEGSWSVTDLASGGLHLGAVATDARPLD